jgi:very-short-patch-repair endonuclease
MLRTKPILTYRAKALRQNQTEAEKLLWASLRSLRPDGTKFRRQQPIDDYIVDFVHLDKKLIIEVDGGQHNEPQTIAGDNKRTAYLESQGFHLIRFWDSDVLRNMDVVLEKIRETLAELSPSPLPLPLPSRERSEKE